MDQKKIGRFIAAKRKEKSLTQQALADLVGISNKTVSKWECGNGLPEVSLMLPLCNALGITVNELLSGETLDNSYQEKAEENLIGLIKEKETQRAGGKKIMIVQGAALVSSVLLWLLLFADSNVYQLGDFPTPLTLGYLVAGFAAIYLVMMTAWLGIVKRNMMMIFAAFSFASLVCLLISFSHATLWLVPPAAAGMLGCFALSIWSYFHHKRLRQ